MDQERELRAAERRGRAVIRRVSLKDDTPDPDAIQGADAISLVTQLTRASWSLSGRPNTPKTGIRYSPLSSRPVPGRWS